MNKRQIIYITIFLWILNLSIVDVKGQNIIESDGNNIEKIRRTSLLLENIRIDSIIKGMTLEQKIAQLMIVRSGSSTIDTIAVANMIAQINKYGYGGVCFFKGDSWSVYSLANTYKKTSKIPLWITIDGEWGPAMRLTDINPFPMQQTLGAIRNNELLFKMGELVGEQCCKLGISWNFIPSVDVNSNALNPVINMRSFGEDPKSVAIKGISYYKGMNSKKVIGSAKHFPGHGDTEKDSHYGLPVIKNNLAHLDSVEMYPFRRIIDSGVESVMMAHLKVDAVDSIYPTSLSKKWIEKLRNELGFKGIVITDGLEMKGVYENGIKYGSGEVEVMAIEAGEDVLLLPADPIAAIKAITKAVKQGRISEKRIDSSLYRILTLKVKMFPSCSNEYAYKDSLSLIHDINTNEAKALTIDLYAGAVTVLENEYNVLPIRSYLYPLKVCVHIGDYEEGNAGKYVKRSMVAAVDDEFGKELDWYAAFDHYYIDKSIPKDEISDIIKELCAYDLVVVGAGGTSSFLSKKYGIDGQVNELLHQIQTLPGAVVLSMFAPPYALTCIEDCSFASILCGYQDVPSSHIAAARIIYGGSSAIGQLPVSVGTRWKAGIGEFIQSDVLSSVLPEQIGFKSEDMIYIDSVVQNGIDMGAYPGCQVLIAHKGKVFYNKNFGHYTFEKRQEVETKSIYDIASLTKIFATTLAYMKLYDQGRYDLDEKISNKIQRIQRSNKKDISFRQLLAHESGLKAVLPYMDDSVYKGVELISKEESYNYPLQIAEGMFLYNGFRKILKEKIDKSPLGGRDYLYSDLGFFYLYEALEHITGQSIEEYVQKNFYDSLGLKNTMYHPLNNISISDIVPTEKDEKWRKQTIRGFVHDPLAALLGGGCGSAGLFSNATDVAVLSQLLLQKGNYGGIRYIDSATVELFTSSDFSSAKNRRGGGFDKPVIEKGKPSPCAVSASKESYGHSGFTGTFFWVDPTREMIYVFLSNRVSPSAADNKLSKMGIRTQIQEYIYRLLDQNNKGSLSSKDTSPNIIR